jgi:hypothetical protein
VSQRLKLKIFRKFCTNLNLSFIHVRGEVGHDDFLSEDVAWHRRRRCRGSSRAPRGGLSRGLASDSSLSNTGSATGTAGNLLLLGNDLRKRLDIVGADPRLHTSSRDLSRTIADAIRVLSRVFWSLRAGRERGTSECSAKGVCGWRQDWEALCPSCLRF